MGPLSLITAITALRCWWTFFKNTESQIAPRLYIFSQNTNLNKFLYTSTITQAEETTPSAPAKKSKPALWKLLLTDTDIADELQNAADGWLRSPALCRSLSSLASPRSPSRSSALSLGSAWWLSGLCEVCRRRRTQSHHPDHCS